jgi:serine/threonine protein kinase
MSTSVSGLSYSKRDGLIYKNILKSEEHSNHIHSPIVEFAKKNLEKFNIPIPENKDLTAICSDPDRRILKTERGTPFLVFNRRTTENQIPVGLGAQKKAFHCLDLRTGNVPLVTIMDKKINSKRQKLVLNKIKESIEQQKNEGTADPALERFTVPIYGTAEYINKLGKERIAIIQEYMNGGELSKGIRDSSFTAEDTIEILSSILEGVCELHKIGIYVRDIKGANVLWGRDPEGKIRVKMNDFDLSCFSNSKKAERRSITGTYSHGCSDYLAGLMEDDLDKQDIWATGMVLYKLVTNLDLPWMEEARKINQTHAAVKPKNMQEKYEDQQVLISELYELITKYSHKINQWFPIELKAHPMGNLIYLMLTPNFKKRPDAKEVWHQCQEILKNPEHLKSFVELYNQFHQR